jgi:hypothetical protein
MQVKKWEVPTTRFASEAQTRVLLYPFFAPHKRQLHSGTAKNNPTDTTANAQKFLPNL